MFKVHYRLKVDVDCDLTVSVVVGWTGPSRPAPQVRHSVVGEGGAGNGYLSPPTLSARISKQMWYNP